MQEEAELPLPEEDLTRVQVALPPVPEQELPPEQGKDFLHPVSEPTFSWPPCHENSVLDDSKPMCKSGRLFGRSKLPDLSPQAYELFSQVHLDPLPLPLQDEGLNLAAGSVRKYLHLGKDFECLHIMVRAVAFSSFLRALEEGDAGQTQFLPFFCWCDGGTY